MGGMIGVTGIAGTTGSAGRTWAEASAGAVSTPTTIAIRQVVITALIVSFSIFDKDAGFIFRSNLFEK